VLGLVITPTALTTVGWRPLWVANAALLAGYAVLVAALNRRPAHGAAPRPASPPRPLLDAAVTALRAPGPVLLALVFGAYAMQYMAVVGFLPTIYAEQDVALDVAGLLTAGVVAANLIGVLAAGPLLAAGVPRWLLMVAASAVMLGCAVLVFWPGASLAVAYPAALTLTAVGGVIPSSILAAVPLVAPDAGLVGAVKRHRHPRLQHRHPARPAAGRGGRPARRRLAAQPRRPGCRRPHSDRRRVGAARQRCQEPPGGVGDGRRRIGPVAVGQCQACPKSCASPPPPSSPPWFADARSPPASCSTRTWTASRR
jgi:hypothetical protein